jgi:hypothetical protein
MNIEKAQEAILEVFEHLPQGRETLAEIMDFEHHMADGNAERLIAALNDALLGIEDEYEELSHRQVELERQEEQLRAADEAIRFLGGLVESEEIAA